MPGDLNEKVVVVPSAIIGDVDTKDIDSGNLTVKFIISTFVL